MFDIFNPCHRPDHCCRFDLCCRKDHCCRFDHCDITRPSIRTHVHEFTGSTRFNENGPLHNHRFAGVSGPAIPTGNSHVHLISTNTDNTNHFHQINVFSGPAIPVGSNRHVHFVSGRTSIELGHDHGFINATLIEHPN